jgi:hypothetical protein
MKGKALRRALASTDALRINAETAVPLIVTTTELLTPDSAKAMLQRNTKNRPINWKKVEEYAETMRAGRWRLHDQGVMLDTDNNILTGQKRLWAVIKAGVNIYMRISRGNPAETASLIDRGVPQSARDLAARETGRMHSPTEASLGRAMLVLHGNLKPSVDELAAILHEHEAPLRTVMAMSRGSRKSRELLMVIAALMVHQRDDLAERMPRVPILIDQLRTALLPRTATECWGRGAAFSLAMEQARRLVLAI